jgi:hypothetical protein
MGFSAYAPATACATMVGISRCSEHARHVPAAPSTDVWRAWYRFARQCQLSSRQRALKPERRQVCLECEVSLNSSRASFEAAQGLFSPSAGAPAQLSATKPGMALSHFEDRHDSEPPHGDEPQYLFLFGRLTRALSLSHASPVRTFHPLPRASVIGASALSLPALLTNGRCQVRQQAAPKPRNRSWL